MVVLMADLLTPFFIWKGIVPPPIRWISSIGVAILAGIAFARMMALDRIPRAVLVIGALSAIGITVALLEGQGLLATAWGWWRMFEFVLVGLFAYLSPHWPRQFPRRLLAFCVGVLGMEVLFQIGQFLTGEPIGDNLAGTFGWHGVGSLAIFIMFVLCLGLGQWLSEGRWKILLIAITLGLISSVLGEIKIFTAAALALSMLAALFFVLRSGQLWKLIPFVVLAGIVVWVFAAGYNAFVSGSSRPLQQYYLDAESRNAYLNLVRQSVTAPDRFSIGRNFALKYGWDTILSSPTSTLFGFGLGARGESRSLGIVGVALEQGSLGLSRGTSLLVMMQEMGLFGMIVIGGFILWVAVVLLRDIRRYPQSDGVQLRYALLLFSLLWPIWLWYLTVWTFRVPMLLYWVTLGYVLNDARHRHMGLAEAALSDLEWRGAG